MARRQRKSPDLTLTFYVLEEITSQDSKMMVYPSISQLAFKNTSTLTIQLQIFTSLVHWLYVPYRVIVFTLCLRPRLLEGRRPPFATFNYNSCIPSHRIFIHQYLYHLSSPRNKLLQWRQLPCNWGFTYNSRCTFSDRSPPSQTQLRSQGSLRTGLDRLGGFEHTYLHSTLQLNRAGIWLGWRVPMLIRQKMKRSNAGDRFRWVSLCIHVLLHTSLSILLSPTAFSFRY